RAETAALRPRPPRRRAHRSHDTRAVPGNDDPRLRDHLREIFHGEPHGQEALRPLGFRQVVDVERFEEFPDGREVWAGGETDLHAGRPSWIRDARGPGGG